MALIGNCIGEITIVSPEGTVNIWLSKQGRVAVNGSRLLFDSQAWFLDQIKGARSALKTGIMPQGFQVFISKPSKSRSADCFGLGLLELGAEAVRNCGRHRIKGADKPPDANRILKARGLPYRVRF